MTLMTYFASLQDFGDDERGNQALSDYMAKAFINKKFQAFDLELYNSKWWDYRFMTPLKATDVYTEHYATVYRRIYAREFDRDRAKLVRPPEVRNLRQRLAEGETKAKRIFTGLWRGRQFADALGMPYDAYIEYAFTYRMRAWQRTTMPQSWQLYHEIDLEKVQARWQELQEVDLCLATHPAYLVQNFADLPVQNAYHEWLFVQAGRRGNREEALAWLVENDHLPLDKARARLENDWQIERFERYLDQS